MVRYKTGRAVFTLLSEVASVASSLAEWASTDEPGDEVPEPDSDDEKPRNCACMAFRSNKESQPEKSMAEALKELVLESADQSACSTFTGTSGPPSLQGESSSDSGKGEALLRAIFTGWRMRHRQIREARATVAEQARQKALRGQALNLWMQGPSESGPRLRASLQAWLEATKAARELRIIVRSRQRMTSLPEVHSLPTSQVRALGAFLCSTAQTLTWCSFRAWRDWTQEVKRRGALMLWLMERWALTQTGLLLQAMFKSWSQLCIQCREPAWAIALKEDVQALMEVRSRSTHPPTSQPSSHTTAPQEPQAQSRHRHSAVRYLGCLCAFILVLGIAKAPQSQKIVQHATGVDTDSDGVPDAVDRCPSSDPVHKFQSTWHTDWDRDGCLDSVEDADDDGDSVLNEEDLCPRTTPADTDVDAHGCSQRQRQLLAREAPSHTSKMVEITLEVVIGMILTALLNFLLGDGRPSIGDCWLRMKSLAVVAFRNPSTA